MYHYSKLMRATVTFMPLFLLLSFQHLIAQNLDQNKETWVNLIAHTEAQLDLKEKSPEFIDHFMKESFDGEISSDQIFSFSLNKINLFMAESKLFNFEDDRLVLPFRSKALKTIPQWVNSGGLNFEVFMGAKTKDQSVLKYLISSASELFSIDPEQIELRFFWYDQKGKRLIGGPNTLSVVIDSGKLSACVINTTEAADGVGSHTALGDVQKFYRKGNWQEKIAGIDRD